MKSDPLISYRRKTAYLNTRILESFAEALRELVARGREFHCRITGDREIASLNSRFCRRDYPTDVLTFPQSAHAAGPLCAAGNMPGPGSLGDIAISLDRARAQSREYGHSVEDEIRILMLHGVLHLIGMDHESDSGRMRRAETRWRRKFGLPCGLIERVA